MKLLRSYVLKELMVPFIGSLLIFTFIFVVGNLVQVADLVMNQGVSIWEMIKIIILLLPNVSAYTIPMSALTALLLVFGAMAKNYEIVAMRACGINIVKMFIPVLFVGLFLSIVSLIMNDQILPKTHFAYRRAFKNILIETPLAAITPGKFIKDFDGFVLFVHAIKDGYLENVTIYQTQDDAPTRTITAQKGKILTDKDKRTLSLELYNGMSDEPTKEDPSVFYKLDFERTVIGPLAVDKRETVNKKTKDMTIDELYGHVQQLRRAHEGSLNKSDQEQVNKLIASIHKKVAFSFAPFVFTMISLPLALITRRGDVLISFGYSLIVITVYYVLLGWAETIAIKGLLPSAVALWLPNAMFVIVSIWMTRRVVNR